MKYLVWRASPFMKYHELLADSVSLPSSLQPPPSPPGITIELGTAGHMLATDLPCDVDHISEVASEYGFLRRAIDDLKPPCTVAHDRDDLTLHLRMRGGAIFWAAGSNG